MKIKNREDIQVGDVVTYHHIEGGFLVTRTAKARAVKCDGYVLDNGRWIKQSATGSGYAIVSIERPEPPLPTDPGTVIDAKVVGVDSMQRLLRTNLAVASPWVAASFASGSRWLRDDEIESWTLVVSA